jgi:hypothetical protein
MFNINLDMLENNCSHSFLKILRFFYSQCLFYFVSLPSSISWFVFLARNSLVPLRVQSRPFMSDVANRDVALFANASSTQPTGTLTTAPGLGSSHTTVCSGCTYELLASILTWLSLDVTTLTATIFIVDNTTNSTSISVFTDNAILTGTSISLYTPLPTNADGVPVTTVTLLNNQLEPSITVV